PSAWLVLAVLIATLLAAAVRLAPGEVRERSVWGPPVAALAVPLVLLLPWWLPAVASDAGAMLLLDVGRWPTTASSGVDLLTARLADLGAPAVVGLLIPLLALVALRPATARIPALICWSVAAVAAVIGLPLALVSVDIAGPE